MRARRGAYKTVEAASAAAEAAVQKAGALWPLEDNGWWMDFDAADRLREVRDGLRGAARAGAKLKRAIAAAREAATLLRACDDALGEDYWLPESVRNLPDVLRLLEKAESDLAADVRSLAGALKSLPGRRKGALVKRQIIRTAERASVKLRPAEWGYIFIALGIIPRCAGPAAWRLRLIDLSTDLREVGGSLRRHR